MISYDLNRKEAPMGVQLEDRTTIDMFTERQKGRPRSNPYPREVQLRINKRVQRARDKNKGMRRMEVKMPQDLVEKLDQYAEQHACTRTEAVELSISEWFALREIREQDAQKTNDQETNNQEG